MLWEDFLCLVDEVFIMYDIIVNLIVNGGDNVEFMYYLMDDCGLIMF